MKRVAFVGQNPGAQSQERRGDTMYRFKRWLDSLELPLCSFVNCSSKTGVVHISDFEKDFVAECLEGYDKIVTLGSFASHCLDIAGIEHHRLPHPSPRNRLINDVAYIERELEKCKGYIWEKS